MKPKWGSTVAVVAGTAFVLLVGFVLSALTWGPWWQTHYGEVGMRFRYLDKNPTVLTAFVADSIKHLEDRSMVRCAPPSQYGDGRVGTGTEKGELMADCFWFKSPTFPGYFRLESWGDPLYGVGLSAVAKTPRPPMGASITMMALTNPPELLVWDKWAADHGARARDEINDR